MLPYYVGKYKPRQKNTDFDECKRNFDERR